MQREKISLSCKEGTSVYTLKRLEIIHCHLKFYAYIIQIVQAVDLDHQSHWKEFSLGMLRWTSNYSKK